MAESSPQNTNLIVNYIPVELSDVELNVIFKAYGDIESCRIIRNKTTGCSLCYGFVKFKRLESAILACNKLNGLRFFNKTLRVAFSKPQSYQADRACTLHVRNLPASITDLDLEHIFEQFGNIIYVRTKPTKTEGSTQHHDAQLQSIKGKQSYVRYEHRSSALSAMAALNNLTLEGCTEPMEIEILSKIQTTSTQSSLHTFSSDYQLPYPMSGISGLGTSRKTLMVDNLSPCVNEVALMLIFQNCGTVTWVKIERFPNGSSKGLAFVTMASEEETVNALRWLHNSFVADRLITVTISPSF